MKRLTLVVALIALSGCTTRIIVEPCQPAAPEEITYPITREVAPPLNLLPWNSGKLRIITEPHLTPSVALGGCNSSVLGPCWNSTVLAPNTERTLREWDELTLELLRQVTPNNSITFLNGSIDCSAIDDCSYIGFDHAPSTSATLQNDDAVTLWYERAKVATDKEKE